MSLPDTKTLAAAATAIRDSRCTVAFTGAGISVPSGIPDFRSPGGLWSRYDPEQVCSEWALRKNPVGVWEFLRDALELFDTATPNQAHIALAELERHGLLSAVITQNIDNLHQEAGSQEVIEYHGNCRRYYCHGCAASYPSDQIAAQVRRKIPVLCASCEAVIRPDVVFFGEAIPQEALFRSAALAREADVMIVVGTSGTVAPANIIPQEVAARGGTVIECNIGPTAYADVTSIRFDGAAEEILPLLAQQLLGRQ